MKVLTAEQHRALDAATISEERITSLQLMERASTAFVTTFLSRFSGADAPVAVICGPGNNGGDGMAVARLLYEKGFDVTVLDAGGRHRSKDNAANLLRIRELKLPIAPASPLSIKALPQQTILIDALFGTGISRPIMGEMGLLVEAINETTNKVISIDLPSGLPADKPPAGAIVKANHTISLGYPKQALFAPNNAVYLGDWDLALFKVSTTFISALDTDIQLLNATELKSLLKVRASNDHKGTFGHALLVAGAYGTMGAATIAGRAILRSGAGLVSCHVPSCGYDIMQISFPEAICQVDPHQHYMTKVGAIAPYRAIGIGPGLGTAALTAKGLRDLLTRYKQPMVLDADALNLISTAPDLLDLVPMNSILTPHPKEFMRLFGETLDDFARTQVQREVARSKGLIILLKTGYTSIAMPTGQVYYNPTGNPGMGTAGTGDALTGILTGLLAQGYEPTVAARLGVYLHGLAGDLAAANLGEEFMLAGDVVEYLGRAFAQLRASA